MPLTPDWATFFSAELAALATLTGFVVVAISIDLERILAYSWLPSRAGEALVGPVGAVTATSLVLIPDQPAAAGQRNRPRRACDGRHASCGSGANLARSQGCDRDRTHHAGRHERRPRIGVCNRRCSFVGGARAALYWIGAADMLIIAIVLSAWVLLVEILR
jgi:hypothetical protein